MTTLVSYSKVLLGVLFLQIPILANSFAVTSSNDSGPNSLRQALLDSNANPGADVITFAIGSGVQTIILLTPLPDIIDPVTIDGSTQPGFAGTPLVVLSGSMVNGSGDVYGLHITAGNSTVKSLVISNFNNPAPQALRIDTNGGNVVQGCYIGLDATGTNRARNYKALVIASSDNLIGGTSPAERNVISGSSFENVSIVGAASNNRIQGNFIGTNATGTGSLNTGGLGIEVASTGINNIIGGTEPGAGNLISGNGQFGIRAGALQTIIQGNLIGTDVTGTASIPNFGGVALDARDSLVGGNVPGARNVISGNIGPALTASTFTETLLSKVQGNLIGTDITGHTALGPGGGIIVDGALIIGGSNPGEGNVISSIHLSRNGPSGLVGSIVQGNLIGTDSTGTVTIGPSSEAAIQISSNNNLIGGTVGGAGNLIARKAIGIQVGGTSTAAVQGNVIQGNHIGLNPNSGLPAPNTSFGVRILGSSNNQIGGGNGGNTIAYNGGSGVSISNSLHVSTGNSVRGNSIFQNGSLGIDVGNDGVTQNDNCDADTGPNNKQNFPVLASVRSAGSSTRFTGTLNSSPNSAFTIDLYANVQPDASGYGEGKIHLGSTDIITDGGCNAAFDVSLTSQNVSGFFISATATDSSGNSSEFSIPILAPRAALFDYDGDGKTDFSVFRPSSGAWYLQRSTAGFQGLQFGANGDKLAPADYDGDGKTDIAVYRPADGRWYILNSATSTVTYPVFGVAEDLPAPGDYDGDGKADLTLFRPSQGTWYRQNSSNGTFFGFQFGALGDVPTVGDFDGDGKNDLGIWRPSNGDWYNIRSSNGSVFGERFGQTGDKIAPADYDGDGKTDIAIFRPSTGLWVVRNSATATYWYSVFGAAGDIPVAGDYDGDGKADIAVWRPSDGTWYVQRSSNGSFIVFPWGQNGDVPTPAAFGN